MVNLRYHLRSMLLSALGFGVGFLAGGLLLNLLFGRGLFGPLLAIFQNDRLAVGLVLVLVITGLGGAVAGALAGLTLNYAHQANRRWGYAWRGALSYGLSFVLIVVPVVLVVALTGVYELADVSPLSLMFPFGLIGAIFGLISGAALGLLTVGRDTWRVMLVSAVSFAVGGAGLGRGLFGHLLSLEDMRSARWSLFVGVLVFGMIGGAALGFLYSWLARRRPKPAPPARFLNWFRQRSLLLRALVVAILVLVCLAVRAVYLISPFTAFEAPLDSSLPSQTVGTHWAAPVALVQNAASPVLAATDTAALVWSQETNGQVDVYYQKQAGREQGWFPAVNVSKSQSTSVEPQLVLDRAGRVHIIWLETATGTDDTAVLYSWCSGATCSAPRPLSDSAGLGCLTTPSTQNSAPALAIDPEDTLLALWRSGQRDWLYAAWPAASQPPQTPAGCFPLDPSTEDITAGSPRLTSGVAGRFSLAFDTQNGELFVSSYDTGGWASPTLAGTGSRPEIFVQADGQEHLAWCGPDQLVRYRSAGSPAADLPASRCAGRPALAPHSDGLRLVWFADEVTNVRGVSQPNPVLFESFQTGAGWTAPTIITQTGGPVQPVLAASQDGSSHLAWTANPEAASTLFYAAHTNYDCTGVPLSPPGQAVYEVLRQEKYRPASDPIPYCQNRFDRLLYAPNPVPAVSDAPPTPNGTFDHLAELAKTAQYEVVFATMWYDSFHEPVSPGRVLGGAVADLYQKLKEDPARYPRGLTVRILLGNPPKFAFFPTFHNQVWTLMNDLHAAGLPELTNDELGWNVQVANYSGSWPHSHTKMMVVDGQTVAGVGFNMQYSHLPRDHPSGKGKGRNDMGLQLTGPVAQSSLRAFDELWQASTQIDCATIDPATFLWIASCSAQPAAPNHVPEVLSYYLPDQPGNAFSIFRTEKFHEGDEAYAQALAAAKSSLDIIHINFSLDMICALNILVEACNYANRIDYMEAMMQAIAQNGVKTRILVSDIAWVGLENNIAIAAFEDELAARGLSDLVEIRYFEQDMHLKSALIDGQLLFVGSQNFHYSAWGGPGSLTEFNVGTEDPQAIQAFQRYFNYYWDRAKPREVKQ